MVNKKTTKKTHTKKATSKKAKSKKAKIVYEQPAKKKDYFFPLIILITAVIILGFVSNGTFFLDSILNPKESTLQGETELVSVNGEKIYQEELDEYWNKLPPQIKLQLSKEDLLEEFIQERLLLQEADKKGIEVSENEVNEYITAQLSASGLTYEQFETILVQQDTTVERMKEIYTRQLKLAKLFEERSDEDLLPSEAEIQAYYEEHEEDFFSPEQVTIRHILVPVNENLDDATAQERVADIEAQLEESNNSNFCDLVTEFSGDPGSLSNCGEYTFAKGAMVQEFEEAGFDMDINEVRTVKTTFGYHIMLKDDALEATYLELSDSTEQGTVQEIVERILAEDKARSIYEAYIAELKADAEIFYMTEERVEENEDVNNDEIIIDSEDVVVEIN